MQTPTMTTDKDGTIRYRIGIDHHREDGPAVIYADGTQYWFLNNIQYSFDKFYNKLKLSEEDIVFLKLKYNTCVPT